jgi:hypothetical protein
MEAGVPIAEDQANKLRGFLDDCLQQNGGIVGFGKNFPNPIRLATY